MTLREKLRRRLCCFWWTLHHESLDGPFSIPAGGLRPQHLLVVMPPDFEHFDVALRFLPSLIEHLNSSAATVLVCENFRTWLSRDLGVRTVTFNPSLRDFAGLPTSPVCRKVKELGADVAVDLTPRFMPYTAALVAASAAPLRISLDPQPEHRFYNFFLNMEQGKSLGERYEVLLRYV
jgi:hypothetical protein